MKKKERIIGALIILFVAITGSIFMFSFREADLSTQGQNVEIFSANADLSQNAENQEVKNETTQDENNSTNYVIVEIKGEVLNPDVYKMKENSRVNDLIETAGGLTELANTTNLNRASIISDGDCIIISNINEEIQNTEIIQSSVSQGNGNDNKSDLVNINTADLEKLKTISGIGDTKAQAIIDYREQNGIFKNINDLTKITGIGEKTLEKIKDKISV